MVGNDIEVVNIETNNEFKDKTSSVTAVRRTVVN